MDIFTLNAANKNAEKLVAGLASGVKSHEVDNENGTITFHFNDGSETTMQVQTPQAKVEKAVNAYLPEYFKENPIEMPKTDMTSVYNRIHTLSALNKFAFNSFDKGYLTFCVDDGNAEYLDKIASIFEEYNMPLCLAIPPTQLEKICSGLSETTGSYTVGMTVKEVCEKVVELGGEILSHHLSAITATNISNDLLHTVFVDNKKALEEAGFNIRGIILSGGTGALVGGASDTVGGTIFQKLSETYYDYSDQYGDGSTPNYYKTRYNLYGRNNDTIQGFIANYVYKINDWRCVYFHKLDDKDMSETYLRAVLEFCVQKISEGILEVATYATVFDKFKSTELEQRILALESANAT